MAAETQRESCHARLLIVDLDNDEAVAFRLTRAFQQEGFCNLCLSCKPSWADFPCLRRLVRD
jgi:hypothetical protein